MLGTSLVTGPGGSFFGGGCGFFTGNPGGPGGIGGFFKQQLGARSVAPRDGDDPDAILSRAEAAMRDGRLADALAEVKALPPEAQEPLSEWLSDAQARHDAQDAVQTLTQRLTAN